MHLCDTIPRYENARHDGGTAGRNPYSIVNFTCTDGYSSGVGNATMQLKCDYYGSGTWKQLGSSLSCKSKFLSNDGDLQGGTIAEQTFIHPRLYIFCKQTIN